MNVLRDILCPDLTVVFCGTAASAESARRGQYYAGPGNKFWKTLYEIGLTPRLLLPVEYSELPQFGIGLTDLNKVESGSDTDLSQKSFDITGFENKIVIFQPRIICFNGKKAAQTYLNRKDVSYGLQNETIDKAKLFIAPSTSGSANRWWNVSYWHQLAELIRAEVSGPS